MPYVPLSSSPADGKGGGSYTPLTTGGAKSSYQPISKVGLLAPKLSVAPAAVPVAASSPAPATAIPQSTLKGSLGGGYGASSIPDQYSGKPLLTFEDTSTKTSDLLSDRVAPAFDPTVPQKIDPSVIHNGRMPESASEAVRKATGAEPDEQLDHLISLELGGSNDTSNLNNEKLDSSGKQPSLSDENRIANLVANGDKTGVSYIDGQKMIARLKGVQLPDDPDFPSSTHPLAQYYPNPAPNQTGTQSQRPAPAQGIISKILQGISDKAESIAENSLPVQLASDIQAKGVIPGIQQFVQRQGANLYQTYAGDTVKTVTQADGSKAVHIPSWITNAAIGAETEGPQDIVGKIAEDSNPAVIKSILTDNNVIDEETASRISPELAKAKSPQEVLQIISDAKQPEPVKNFEGETNKGITPEQAQSVSRAADKGTAAAAQTAAQAQESAEQRNALEDKAAAAKLPPEDGFIQKLKNVINPLKQQDPETRSIFEDYYKKIANARPLANDEAQKLTNIPAEGSFDNILRYERGSPTPYTGQLSKQFGDLLDEARERGIDVPERKNYIPHAYTESAEEIRQIKKDYLVKKGVPESQAEEFMNGTQDLPQTTARRLGLNPFFSKTRQFPTYEEAVDAGLHPKYTHPAQLAGMYREQLERNVANRELVADLEKTGKLFPADLAPSGYKPVNLEFSQKGYYATPRLAQMLNGIFNDSNSKTFFQHVIEATGRTSRFVQKVELTTGAPGTSINVHSIGQIIKDITAGDFKKIVPFIRANSDAASVRYFEENRDVIQRMAKQGLDLGSTVADYPNLYDNFMRPSLKEKFETGGVKSAGAAIAKDTGIAFQNVFTKKNFSSFMPQLYISTFKEAAERFAGQGMNPTEADALGADTVRAFHGLMGNVGRAPSTEDGLSSVFFAPQFRESIINTMWNSLRSVTTDYSNPAFYKNRRLVGGMSLTFGLYAGANKFLNGHYMWQNPSTHQFDLQIPIGGGNYAYLPFMPTFMAVPRNLLGGALSTAQGDLSGATQQFTSVLAAPLQLFGQLYANKDFFGRAIYNDTDPGGVKAQKIASYLGLNTIPPFVKETVNYIQSKGSTPLYQSITTGMELPIKYGTAAKNNTSDFYDALDNYNTAHAQALAQFRPTFNQIQALIQSGAQDQAQKMVDSLSQSEYDLYKDLKSGSTRAATTKSEAQFLPTYRQIQALVQQGKSDQAQQMVDGLSASDYKLYQSMKKKAL